MILKDGIPRTDVFSFTAFGNHWVAHEWLAEVVLYLVYKIGGLTGLVLFQGIISATIAFLIFHFGVRNGMSAPFSAAATMLAVAGLSYMMQARPHAFSFLFLAVMAYILFKESSSPRARFWGRWAVLPVMLWLWANMHAGFILGLFIYWVVACFEFLFPREKGRAAWLRLKDSILPVLLATILCLINPNGTALFTYPLMISRTLAFKSGISEWVSPIYLGWSEWLAIAILALSSILGLAAAIKLLRRRPDISIIIVAVGASAWIASRNVQNFVIVLSPALLLVASTASFQRIRLKSLAYVSLTGLSLVWILALFFLIRDYQGQHDRTGIGIQKGSVPEDACRFLKSSGFEGNVVNVLGDGGYLIWVGYPRWRVFVDGRLDVYGEAQINEYRRIIDGSPNALGIFEKLGAGAAVLPMPPLIGSVRNLLANDPGWVLAYFDDYYLVYLNRDAKLSTPADALAFKRINPLQSGYGISNAVNPDSLMAEADMALSYNPGSSLVNAVYAQALARQNEYLQAATYYKKALSIQPGHLDMYRFIGEMYSFADARDSAITWLEAALKHRPGDPWIYFDLGMLQARNNDMSAAEYYLRQAVALDPRSPARRMLDRIEAMKSSPK